MPSCLQCGAVWPHDESCANRFAVLLALDHSRQQPWGSRHGVAFAVYTLQHPDDAPDATLERCWLMLSRVYESGDEREDVARGLRATYRGKHDNTHSKSHNKAGVPWSSTSLPHRPSPPRKFDITIATLGDFSAGTYPEALDAWCLATLNAWNEPE